MQGASGFIAVGVLTICGRRHFAGVVSSFWVFFVPFCFFTFGIWHYWSKVDALCFAFFVLYVQYMRDDASCATCRASGLAKVETSITVV